MIPDKSKRKVKGTLVDRLPDFPEGFDSESELSEILKEELDKEILKNGTLTWKEYMEAEMKK